MRAAVLVAKNQPLHIREVPTPELAPGQVRVQLRAAALNHRDVWIQQGMYPGLRYPCIVGSDGAGVVTDTYEGLNRNLLHQEVIINPGSGWGDNPRFPAKDFKILGLPDDGTFAESIVVPAAQLCPKPTHLSFAQAAALPLAGLTAWRALFSRAQLQRHERVLITGVGGGVALVALQLALAAGATVWVTSGSDEKIERAKVLGAAGGANYRADDWSKQLAAQVPEGFDVIIDSAGGEGFAQLMDVAAPGGRIALFGGTRGAWQNVVPQRVFYKQLNIFGTTMGSPTEFAAMRTFVEKHQLVPVVDQEFAFADAEMAMQRMAAGDQFGKLVLAM